MEVDIFIPCFIDQLSPDTGFNMVKVLEHVGCKVHYNPGQTCCGQPAFNAGQWEKWMMWVRSSLPISVRLTELSFLPVALAQVLSETSTMNCMPIHPIT